MATLSFLLCPPESSSALVLPFSCKPAPHKPLLYGRQKLVVKDSCLKENSTWSMHMHAVYTAEGHWRRHSTPLCPFNKATAATCRSTGGALTNFSSSSKGSLLRVLAPKALDGRIDAQVLQHSDLGPQDVELGAAAQVLADAGHVGQDGPAHHQRIPARGRQHACQYGDGRRLPRSIVACMTQCCVLSPYALNDAWACQSVGDLSMTIASLLVSNSVHDCPPLLWPGQDANRAGPKNDLPSVPQWILQLR